MDVVAVFGFPFLVAICAIAYAAFRQYLKHKERMAMIEKGSSRPTGSGGRSGGGFPDRAGVADHRDVGRGGHHAGAPHFGRRSLVDRGTGAHRHRVRDADPSDA